MVPSQRITQVSVVRLMMSIMAQKARDTFIGGGDNLHFKFYAQHDTHFPLFFEIC